MIAFALCHLEKVVRIKNSLANFRKRWSRLLSTVFPSVEASSTPQFSVAHCMGLELLLDRSNSLDQSMLSNGSWEQKQITILEGLCKLYRHDPRRKIFIDLGAHWGLYAMKMAQLKFFDQIIAIEADRHNFSQLQAQFFLNNMAYSATALNVAVSSDFKQAMMLRATDHPFGNRAGAGIFLTEAHMDKFFVNHGHQSVPHDSINTISTVPLDELISEDNGLIIIKLDIEGHEPEALRGMKRLLKSNEAILQIEILPGQDWSPQDLVNEFGLHFLGSVEYDFYFANRPSHRMSDFTSIVGH